MAGVAALVLAAHVSVLQGGVAIARAEGGRVAALRNAPLLTGDALATLSDAQAEIEIDSFDRVRLDSNTGVQLLSLTPHRRDLRLVTGTIDLAVSRNGDAPQVETPVLPLLPDTPGVYRITVSGGTTTVVTERGTLRVLTPNGTQYLASGEQLSIDGTPSEPHLHYAAPPPRDAFDAFNAARTAAESAADMFKTYGSWTKLKSYGPAWEPHEYPGWAPYRSGRWFWRAALGWTWIPKESWGWIPYHSGAWTYDAKLGWCWIPPRRSPAPYWDASNAAFFAVIAGGHAQSIGWFALAPGEPFHAHLNQYRDASARGGVTLLDVRDFYSGNFSRLSTPPFAKLPSAIRLQAPRPRK